MIFPNRKIVISCSVRNTEKSTRIDLLQLQYPQPGAEDSLYSEVINGSVVLHMASLLLLDNFIL